MNLRVTTVLWIVFVAGFGIGLSTGMAAPRCADWMDRVRDHWTCGAPTWSPSPMPAPPPPPC